MRCGDRGREEETGRSGCQSGLNLTPTLRALSFDLARPLPSSLCHSITPTRYAACFLTNDWPKRGGLHVDTYVTRPRPHPRPLLAPIGRQGGESVSSKKRAVDGKNGIPLRATPHGLRACTICEAAPHGQPRLAFFCAPAFCSSPALFPPLSLPGFSSSAASSCSSCSSV